MRIKKGDSVIVITGSHKGKTGEVLACNPEKDRVLVGGVNIRTHHRKPRTQGQRGEIIKKECPIHISNVQLINPGDHTPTRTRVVMKNNKKIRVTVKGGKHL